MPPDSFESKSKAERRCIAFAALTMFSLFVGGLAPTVAQNVPQAGSDVTILALQDDFESVFPGANWTVTDLNTTSGLDYWAASTYRAAGGNRSVWSPGIGNQTILWEADTIFPANNTTLVLFQDDFENGSFGTNWTASDREAASGDDYWGPSSMRVHGGTTSIWSAQVGYNLELSDDNFNVSSYDNDMDTIMSTSVNLTGAPSGTSLYLDFWYWIDAESCCDFLYPVYDDGQGSGWQGLGWSSTGTSGGWSRVWMPIPPEAIALGFVFYADYSVIYEGAYIDDVMIRASPPMPKTGPFTEGFEGATLDSSWAVQDADGNAGADTWDISAQRSHTGASSLWCAQVGDNSELGGTNVANTAYDDGMDTLVWREINHTGLSNFSSIRLSFWYWLDSEQGVDFFSILYYSGGQWTTLNSLDGNSGGWVSLSYALPNDTDAIGFRFTSDTFWVQEGAYVDDVQFIASRPEANTLLRSYDFWMNSTMTRAVSLSQFALVSMQYSYWLATDSANDSLEAMYLLGPNWTYLDRHSGNSSGWQTSNISVPVGATRIGFRFVSDGVGHAEGAYIDSLRLWGTYYPLNCTANASLFSGLEGSTLFYFNGNASEGLRPYSWFWNFSDGINSPVQDASRIFLAVGSYSAVLTVNDAAGQSCTVSVGPVDVAHDTTALAVNPPSASITEGASLTIFASDRLGHAYTVDWSLSSPACGALDSPSGISVVFTSSLDAGGRDCTVTAAVGPTSVGAHVQILHNTTAITMTPDAATVVEGTTIDISAADAAGHGLDFAWSTTCGQLFPSSGASVTFTATEIGGSLCTIRAMFGADSGAVDVTIAHDTSQISVSPTSSLLVEGADREVLVYDAKGHAVVADWSVQPPACGVLSDTTGIGVVLTAPHDAGGLTCTITARVGPSVTHALINIIHDLTQTTIAPKQASLAEGTTVEFLALDTFGHALVVSWAVAPSSCGSLAPESGNFTRLTAGADAAGTKCTVTAVAQGVSLAASVSIIHGPAVRISVNASAVEAPEGGTVNFATSVYDGSGHQLGGIVRTWSTSCGVLEATVGSANSLILPQDGAGTSCTVTVTNGTVSSSATVSIRHARPLTVEIVQTAGSSARSFSLVAKVTDFFGHTIPNATIHWTATCGAFSSETGATTEFNAPAEGGKSCEVTASAEEGGAIFKESTYVTSPISTDITPIVAVVAIAAGGAAALFMVRRRRKPTDVTAPENQPR